MGNLESKRDFTDVKDVVCGYWLALEKGDAGECYNNASGTCCRIEEMLKILLSFSTVSIEVQQDPSRLRPSDVEILFGEYSKFQQRTGWKPEIPFKQKMLDLQAIGVNTNTKAR